MFEKNHGQTKKYLDSRGICVGNIPFEVLYDSDHQNIVCPIRLVNGDLIGATGRKVVKYGNKHHHYFGMATSKCLLGLERSDKSKILIVEGMTDFLNCYDKISQLNLDMNVYATLTCSMSDWQAMQITDLGKPVYLAWDQDPSGKSKRNTAFDKLSGCLWKFDTYWQYKDDRGKIKDPGNLTTEEFKQVFAAI